MRITAIETLRLAEHPRGLWVRIVTDEGLMGLGETWYVPGAVAAVIHDVAAPLLLGERALDLERHWRTLFHVTNYYGSAGAEMRAISALDIALWDLLGRATGRPLYDLLGGRCRRRVRIYNTRASPFYARSAAVPASFGGARGPIRTRANDDGRYLDYEAFHERPAELAESLLGMGITAMKIWPFDGLPAARDGQHLTPAELARGVEPVRRIRERVGEAMEIAIELHSKWNLPAAIQIARALEPYRILWLEDAMTPDPVDDLARLATETSVPICASERLFTRYAFRQLLERRATHIVMPDIIWTGGLTEGRKIAALADTHHLPIAPHDCTGPVNVFACAHLCASTPNVMIMETVRAFYLGFYADLVEPNIDVRDGHLYVPDGPGLGTALRPEVWERPDATVQVSR
jgi:L-alanine-DL-glutamate epimerase-like enolase superfamily enzyme